MAKKYHFTDEMLRELKELYPHTLSLLLAEKYNCSLSAIYYQANKLGVKKTKEFIAETSRKHIELKMKYNETRERMHGKKY